MLRLWVVWLFVALLWLMLHAAHFQARRLFLVHQISAGRRSRALRLPWRLLQRVQTMMLIGSYGLVAAGLLIGKPGQAMWMLTVAITLAGACPDHWRRTGTLPCLYFEVAVIVACCSGVYTAAVQLAAQQTQRVRAQDSVLLASLPLGCLVHYVLVLRTRRTHMPLTATAPLGALTQLLRAEEGPFARLEQAFLSFHAICNINRIQASLERIGSGIVLALYDAVGHFLFGSLLLALACVCLMRSKSWLLGVDAAGLEDSAFLQSSLQGWVIYGSLLCIQAALVGGVYSYYTVVLRRFNPFTVREALVFNRWWSGDALAWVSRRPGRWRNQIGSAASNGGADTLSSSMVPLMANPAQSVVGMLVWAQPSLDSIVEYVGASLKRSIALPISGHVRDIQTRAKAMVDWPIKGFAHQDEISRVGNVLQDVIVLLNDETDDVNLEDISETVGTVGEFATYVLICAGKRASLLPMARALVRALERHNHREYTEAFSWVGKTRKKFRLFGEDGMLSRVMLYSVCVAGVSATWDATDEEDFLHIATAQCAVAILQLHSKFASIQGLVGKLEDDMVTVFGPDQGIRDDTMATSNMFVSEI